MRTLSIAAIALTPPADGINREGADPRTVELWGGTSATPVPTAQPDDTLGAGACCRA